MIRGIVLGAYQKASSVSTVLEPTESCRFEIHGFARFLRTFSSERSASVSFSF